MFQFPPNLDPSTPLELKFITMWELWGKPAVWEIFGDAHHLQRQDSEAVAERVLRELLDEGYAMLVHGSWDEPDAPHEPLGEAEVEDAMRRLRDPDPWKAEARPAWVVPTDRWWEWAEVKKGMTKPSQ